MNVKSLKASLVLLISIIVVSISVSPASAANTDPMGDPLGRATQLLAPVTATPTAPAAAGGQAPATSSDSDLPGNETADPTAPDHGSTQGAQAKIGDRDIAGVGNDNATINNNDSTTADSSLLTLGGQEILGTHADSTGTNESHFGDPLAPLCEGSGGAVCLSVLYADAIATNNGSTSHSQSKSGILKACIGGKNTSRDAACKGPIAVGVATSRAQADRNQSTGQTTASSMFEAANLCLQPDPGTGACTVGASALRSQGQSDSGTGSKPSSASRSSHLLGGDLHGKSLGPVGDPTDLSVQSKCADPSLLCLFLNQGESYLGSGIAGHAQDALKLTLLPGALDVFAGFGHTETLVHAARPHSTPPSDIDTDGTNGGPHGSDEIGGPDRNGALPDTGGPWSGLLAIGMIAIAAGSFAVAFGRRERLALG